LAGAARFAGAAGAIAEAPAFDFVPNGFGNRSALFGNRSGSWAASGGHYTASAPLQIPLAEHSVNG